MTKQLVELEKEIATLKKLLDESAICLGDALQDRDKLKAALNDAGSLIKEMSMLIDEQYWETSFEADDMLKRISRIAAGD